MQRSMGGEQPMRNSGNPPAQRGPTDQIQKNTAEETAVSLCSGPSPICLLDFIMIFSSNIYPNDSLADCTLVTFLCTVSVHPVWFKMRVFT